MSVARVERPARSGPSPRSLQRALLGWFARHKRALPWRETRDPYRIWISEVMLQQTRVEAVKPYFARFMDAFPNVRELAKAPLDRVLKLWAGLGYYSRARNLHLAGQQVVSRHEGVVPASAAGLRTLPGIGRYTAAAIASIAFDERIAVLDGNVKRVLARLFAIRDSVDSPQTTAQLWELAESLVPARLPGDFNQAMMELGATVCTPRTPACPACPVRRHCAAHRTGRVAELPAPRARPATSARRFLVIVAEHAGRRLVRRRPAGEVNGGFWEFPNVEILPGDAADPAAAASRLLGVRHAAPERLGEVRHAITRYRVTQEAWRVRLPRAVRPRDGGAWHTPAELHALPMVTAHRRLLKRLEAA